MARYKDPILNRIKEILDRDGPKELKGKYGIGDPGVVNKSQLPMCFISYEAQSLIDSTSAEWQSTLPIIVNVVYDMSRDFGQGLNATSHSSLIELVCGRNDDFTIRDDSILGALRKNQDMTAEGDTYQLFIDVGTPTDIDFDYQNRNKGLVTAEAVVRFRVITSQLRTEFL